MSLSADEQALFDEAKAILPKWFFAYPRAGEDLAAMAKVFGAGLTQIRDLLITQVRITLADGATATTPDWLNQHAAERGTQRQEGESDQSLADRLRKFEDGITRAVLLGATQAMLTNFGVVGTAYMVELPRDQMFFTSYASNFGSGGIFTAPVSGVMTFKPTVRFRSPPYMNPTSAHDPFTPKNGRIQSFQIVIASATNAGNNGTFVTTGLVGDAVQYTNASGVAANPDNAASWTIKKRDWQDVAVDGRKDAYLSRGFRLGRRGGQIVVILPYGTTEPNRKAIAEMLRLKKGAGIMLRVERRANP
jgi:hypothetical protein